MSEQYPESNNNLELIDGVWHYLGEKDGVVAYRPCPDELVSQLVSPPTREPQVILGEVTSVSQAERRGMSPKLVRGVAKLALLCVVAGGVDVSLNVGTAQMLSGNTRGNINQATEDLWSDMTLPLRMAVGK